MMKSEMMKGLKPAIAMVLVQFGFAGVNIFYKLAINDGMDMRILIAYRYLFATSVLGPLAFFLERKVRPGLTWKILMQAFFCGLFGGSLAQNLYISGLRMTSATFATAMTNLIPAITFVMAVVFSLETLGIRTLSGQAKVLGTLVGIGGAMALTFYKGAVVNLWSSNLSLLGSGPMPLQESGNRVMGSLLIVISCFCYAIWLIIQAKMAEVFPCHYSTTALMCSMAAIQAVAYAVCVDRSWDQWKLGLNIRLLTVIYVGIVASSVFLTVLAWCIRQKGPLYASVYNPLMLLIVALLGSLLLDEKLHVGSIIGAVLIVCGLYIVLWGKGKDPEKDPKVAELPIATNTIEVVIVNPGKSNLQEVIAPIEPPEDEVESKVEGKHSG